LHRDCAWAKQTKRAAFCTSCGGAGPVCLAG
jgi:hypothetical protein